MAHDDGARAVVELQILGQMTGLGEEHLPSPGETLGASIGGPMVGDGDAPAEFASELGEGHGVVASTKEIEGDGGQQGFYE